MGRGGGVNNLRSGRYLVTEPKVVVMGWGGHRPGLSGQGRLLGLGRWAKRGVGVLPTSNAVAATAAPAAGVIAVRGTPGGGESGGTTVIDGGQSGVPERLPLSGTLVQGGEAWGCLGGEVSTSSSTPERGESGRLCLHASRFPVHHVN